MAYVKKRHVDDSTRPTKLERLCREISESIQSDIEYGLDGEGKLYEIIRGCPTEKHPSGPVVRRFLVNYDNFSPREFKSLEKCGVFSNGD